MPMIVCMNINGAGERYIAYLRYCLDYNRVEMQAIARAYKEDYDEVYIIDIDNCNDDFINAIVLGGTRV